MVQIAGKYQVGESKSFYELLVALGVPEDVAKVRSETKYTLQIEVDGKNIKLTTDTPPNTTTLVVGEEVEEKVPGDAVILSTAKLEGNVITVTSRTKDGKPGGVRSYTFSDKGMETVIEMSKDGKKISATRHFNRI